MSHIIRLAPQALVFAALSTLVGQQALAQHKWYQGPKDRGFQENVPDFYQHQFYEGAITNSWQTHYPDSTAYPKWGELGGLCYQVAITNAIASWQPYGYKGLTAAGTLEKDTWRTAYKTTVEDVKAGFAGAGGFQKYLDDRKAANKWDRRLLFNQYTMEKDGAKKTTGTVLTPSGKKIQESDGKGGFKPVSAFDVYKRMIINEASVTLLVEREEGKTYSDIVWWGNYHAVTGVGFDGKTGEIFYSDPDSNKGNRSAKTGYKVGSSEDADSGDGGWVFNQQKRGEADPRKGYTWIDPVSGAEVADVKDGKKFTWRHLDDKGAITTTNIDGGGPEAVLAKGADENVNKRKFVAADSAVPIPGRAKVNADPTNFNSFYGSFKMDNSAPDKAFTVKGSDDFDRKITSDGRYTGVNISSFDVIHPAGFDELGKVKDGVGVTTDIKLASASTLPVDRIQLCSVNTAAQYDASLDGHSFVDSDGGIWRASFISPLDGSALDAMGNSLAGKGGWEFILQSGAGLAPLDRELGIQTTLDAFIRTDSDLVQFDLLMHSMEVSLVDDEGSYTMGDFWTIQSYGFDSIDRGLQTGLLPQIPAPGALGLAIAGLLTAGRRRR